MRDNRDELVRINEHGEVHPIGAVASARMRQRSGAFRVLPAPKHVVLMRYTGEDGRRDEEDGAVVRIGGEIARAGIMCEIFGLLANAGWKGELVVFDGSSERSLFFDCGNVVGGTTTAPAERLGEIMYRFGALSQEQHELLASEASERRVRLGEHAVKMGLLTQEEVFKYLRKQTEEIFHATLLAEDGTYFFLDGYDASRLSSSQTLNASALLMDGVTRMDEIRYFRDQVPSAEYVPVKVEKHSGLPGDDFLKTYAAIDGESSVSELGRETGLGEFAITRDVFALMRSNHVYLCPPRLDGGSHAVVALANEALRQIHKYLDEAGKKAELQSALAAFAAGAGLFDILFRGSDPDPHGQLNAAVVAENAILVSAAEPEITLRQMLHDYLGFALFSAGQMLSPMAFDLLQTGAGEIIRTLQPPHGDSRRAAR